MVYILGLHDTHNPGAALFKDNQLISVACEEHLSRTKHEYGFPERSIKYVLAKSGINPSQIDYVTLDARTTNSGYYQVRRNATFSVSDYWLEQESYWFPKLYKNANPSYASLFPNHLQPSFYAIPNEGLSPEEMWTLRCNSIASYLSISPERVVHVDHHQSHAQYGCFFHSSSPDYLGNEYLVITIDGGGDDHNASISIFRDNQLTELRRYQNCNIGRIYRYITLLLGMRPADHEFKVMGLAAYSSSSYGQEAYEIFANTLNVQGLNFYYKTEIKDHFFYFKDKLKHIRFDNIAFGVQKFTENLICDWIANIVREYGIRKVLLSGGVAQNIKATQLLLTRGIVDAVFVPPGPGDESICIGGASRFFQDRFQSKSPALSNSPSPYFYLETPISDLESHLTSFKKEFIVTPATPASVAHLLSTGEVVGRINLSEPMEFGARALGNRSFLADPRSQETINTINRLIKVRDFWMPFAPSILDEYFEDYMQSQPGACDLYMSVAFDSTSLAKETIPACLHPFDKTARPQRVLSSLNPSYHELISEFYKITGVPVLLNTSLNIHGDPIVATLDDGLDTLRRSGLKHLYVDNYLISKK